MTDASRSFPLDRRGHPLGARVVFVYASFVLGVAVVLGGGTLVGLTADAVIQLLSIPLLVVSGFTLSETDIPSSWRWPLAILVAALVLPLLQLIPMPPALWTLMPSRQFVVEGFRASGGALPWLPISLAPHATVYSFFSMLPAAALFLVTLNLDTDHRFALLRPALILGALSVLLGLAQLFGPDPAGMSLYEKANIGDAIGFFANRNHFAAILYTLLPLSVAWLVGRLQYGSGRRVWVLVVGGTVILLMLVGMSVAFSRAGVALGVIALFGTVLLVWRATSRNAVRRWPIVVAAVVLLLLAVLMQLGLISLLAQRSYLDDMRPILARITAEAVGHFYVAGSGFGTFVPIYMSFEKILDVKSFYANHAHNDWLELLLEGGILVGIVMVAFLIWFFTRAVAVWRASTSDDDGELLLARAGSLSMVLLMLHSGLDYPLRTTTLMCLFAVCGGLLCPTRARTPSESARVRAEGGSRSKSASRRRRSSQA